MKEKKNISLINIFIYFLIVVLIVLIVLPPVMRVFFKEDKVSTTNKISATALTCKKEVTVGTMIYNVTITSNYTNNTLNKVTFNYQMPTTVDNTITDNSILTEINYIRNTALAEETANDTSVIFVITKEAKDKNPTNTTLDDYFQPLDTQKTNLESFGYTCSTLTA